MVWMNSGMAIHRMVRGWARMVSPLKLNSRTRVSSKAVMETGVSTCRNLSWNHASPLRPIIQRRLK